MSDRTDRERLAMTFDAAADIYDAARPDYPAAVFDDLIELCDLRAGARVLEIGCGTGKATLPLARRGLRIRCLEPGRRLAAVARRNLAQFPDVTVDVTTFESAHIERAAYDLVLAATSFHWLDPDTRYTEIAAVLRPGGCAAVLDNIHVNIDGDDEFWVAVQQAYAKHDPGSESLPTPPESVRKTVDPRFIASGEFEQLAVRHYPWTETYDTQRYLQVLRTFSGHLALPETRRAALLADIATIIDRDFGGSIVKHWVTTVQIARKIA